jgi:hypothetical protein
MPQYQVVVDCYVPVGVGTRFKRAGQIVTLDRDDAADLRGYVEPANGRAPRAATTTRVTAKKTTDRVVADLNLKLADADAPPTESDDDGDDEE